MTKAFNRILGLDRAQLCQNMLSNYPRINIILPWWLFLVLEIGQKEGEMGHSYFVHLLQFNYFFTFIIMRRYYNKSDIKQKETAIDRSLGKKTMPGFE